MQETSKASKDFPINGNNYAFLQVHSQNGKDLMAEKKNESLNDAPMMLCVLLFAQTSE